MPDTQQLVLASTSPFRKAILQKLNVPFDTASPDVDESRRDDESPAELVARLSAMKAQAVAAEFPEAIIIGSDQVACIDDQILGKPGTHENAVTQLQHASGRSVLFYTGLCVFNANTGIAHTEVETFEVVFRKLNDEKIENYLRAEEPYNCAGSFKSEAMGIALFEKLHGDDPNTLIGLPLIRLVRLLEEEGMRVI